MDRKSIIILVAAIALYFVASPVIDHYFPPKKVVLPPPSATHPQGGLTNAPQTGGSASNAAIPSPGAPQMTTTPAPRNESPEQIIAVTNADLIWHFTSRGGGVKDIELLHFRAVIRAPGQPAPASNELACLNRNAILPIFALMGSDLDGTGDFELSKKGDVVHAEKKFQNGLRIVKEFTPGTNYLFTARLWLENSSAEALPLPDRDIVIGTATAIGPLDDPTAIGGFWYNGAKSTKVRDGWFANHLFGCVPGTGSPRWRFEEGATNVVWAAVDNQFFVLAAIPPTNAAEVIIDKIRGDPPDMSGPTNAMSAYLTNGYQASLVCPKTTLAAHQTVESDYTFYAGPKEYNRLAHIGETMDNNLDLVMDFTGVFGYVSKLMLLAMNGLHSLLDAPYWLNIIIITFVLKMLFWPLTASANKSQKRMQALQPQLKAISEKYKDDAVKKNEKTLEFYKQNKINPMGSCIPSLLQLPVFIGFYWMLRGAIELRGAHFLWAWDLSQPDTVASITLPFLGSIPINPLPLIMGATQLWQSHTMPPSPGMDPAQQKLMRWMPLMMIAFFYRMSAGLTLYWTVSTLLSILQLKLTKPTDTGGAVTVASTPVRKKR